MFTTSRSQIESYLRCPRLNYLEYFHEGTGLDLNKSATALHIGSCAHHFVETVLSGGDYAAAVAAAHAHVAFGNLEAADDRDLVDALCMTWWHVGRKAVAGWTIESVEREEHFDHPAGIRFQSRSDWLASPPPGTVMNSVPVGTGTYVWNLKTWRGCGDREREMTQYDPQVMTELVGPEQRLGTVMAGVIYQVLIKENHPLVWVWRHPKDGTLATRYQWKCVSPHENTHTKAGGSCPGGKFHRLGDGYVKVPVRDLPGGMTAHFDYLCATDPDLLAEYHVLLGPMRRKSNYEIEEWCDSHLPRESRLAVLRPPTGMALPEEVLRAHFPKHAGRNCFFPLRCAAFEVCHGSADLGAFPLRVPNHPVSQVDE